MARFHSCVLHGLVLFLLTGLSTPRSILLDESSPDRQLQAETTPPTVTLFPVVEPITDGVEAQEALEEAWALWNSSGPVAYYQLGFRRVCECTEEYLAPSISTVENGVIVEVLVGNGTLLDSDSLLFQNAYSVEVLFGILESALEEGIYYEIRVDYDATYGYPTSVYIDYDFNMADEEFNVVIDSFQLLDHGNDGNQTSSTSSPTKGAQEALEEAMARWEVFTNGGNRYCTLITSDDVLMKKKNLTSVEDFFVRIQKALDDEADVIKVDYDVTMGYPISVDIDYNVNVKGEDEDVSAEIVVILEGQEGEFFTCDTPESILSGSGVSTPRRLFPFIASLQLLSVATLLMITMSMA